MLNNFEAICLLLILNRLIYFPLPCHGDIGFFANWGHFKEENLKEDLIIHNGGFRSFALFYYALFKKVLGWLDLRYHSRLGQLAAILLSIAGWKLVLPHMGFAQDHFFYFLACYAFCVGAFSTGVVYIYTIELLGICFLPWILLFYFQAPLHPSLLLGSCLFLSYLFKINLSIEIVFLLGWFYIPEAGFALGFIHGLLGVLFSLAAYYAYLKVLGVFDFAWHGFFAFAKFRDSGWYAWKRLLLPFLKPILWEHSFLLAFGIWGLFTQPTSMIFSGLWLGAAILGILAQKGFFHYHYIALIPSLSLFSSTAIAGVLTIEQLILILGVAVLIRWIFFSSRQWWPKALVHQRIYNDLVEEIPGSKFEPMLRESRSLWVVGWRLQIYYKFHARPFSLFLHGVKYQMVFDEADEHKYCPEFYPLLLEKIKIRPTDLIILEENQYLHLPTLEKCGFQLEYEGEIQGRLRFYKVHSDKLNESYLEQNYQKLFVRYPGQFNQDFFERMGIQYLQQSEGAITLVCDNEEKFLKMKNWIEGIDPAREVLKMLPSELRSFSNRPDRKGCFWLVFEGRSIDFYNQIHEKINSRFQIFKFT